MRRKTKISIEQRQYLENFYLKYQNPSIKVERERNAGLCFDAAFRFDRLFVAARLYRRRVEFASQGHPDVVLQLSHEGNSSLFIVDNNHQRLIAISGGNVDRWGDRNRGCRYGRGWRGSQFRGVRVIISDIDRWRDSDRGCRYGGGWSHFWGVRAITSDVDRWRDCDGLGIECVGMVGTVREAYASLLAWSDMGHQHRFKFNAN